VPEVEHPQAVPHEHQRLLHPQPLLAQHHVAFHEPAGVRVAREHLQSLFVVDGALTSATFPSLGL
jgi:hypothetical protein